MIASISNQATHMERRWLTCIPSHGAIALLDPPANPAFGSVVRAIQGEIAMFIAPGTVKGKTRPYGPSVADASAHPIRTRKRLAVGGRARLGSAYRHVFQCLLVVGVAGGDARAQVVQICQCLFGRPTAGFQ
jgi:hypothetical protein